MINQYEPVFEAPKSPKTFNSVLKIRKKSLKIVNFHKNGTNGIYIIGNFPLNTVTPIYNHEK